MKILVLGPFPARLAFPPSGFPVGEEPLGATPNIRLLLANQEKGITSPIKASFYADI